MEATCNSSCFRACRNIHLPLVRGVLPWRASTTASRNPSRIRAGLPPSSGSRSSKPCLRRRSRLLPFRPSTEAGTSFHSRLRDQLMHVNIDGRFEEPGVAGVVVLDRRMTRIVAEGVHELVVPRLVDEQLFRVR